MQVIDLGFVVIYTVECKDLVKKIGEAHTKKISQLFDRIKFG